MSRNVPLDQLVPTLNNLIKEWSAEVVTLIEEAQDESIEVARKGIKKMTPPKSGRKVTDDDGNLKNAKYYINCYSIKRNVVSDHSSTLYNRKYPLSHLLEDGHEVYNQYGGPYPINRRTAKNRPNAKVDSNMLTTKFEMWELEGEPASVDYVHRAIKKIRKLGG